MNKKITNQADLMRVALKLLEDYETITRLIKPVDPVIAQVMCEEIACEYADVCCALVEEIG